MLVQRRETVAGVAQFNLYLNKIGPLKVYQTEQYLKIALHAEIDSSPSNPYVTNNIFHTHYSSIVH